MKGKDTRKRPEIMCTLTVRQILDEPQTVLDMYAAGMRSVRINTAHLQDAEELERLTSRLKSMLPDIRILIDTKGPEMRTTAIKDGKTLSMRPGENWVIEGVANERCTTLQRIYVNYPDMHTEVHQGDRLLIDDGKLSLMVESVVGSRVNATVIDGGELGSKKGVAVAGKDLNLPAVSERDRMFIGYGATSPLIDEIAHSFVRSPSDVMAVREAMGHSIKPIIAKIENQQGIDNLCKIIRVSDGILIARGDLTSSIGKTAIPNAQSEIAIATKESEKPLYLATNILPSMMHSLQPSAADIDGITIAKKQGVDVMLLTNETATGVNPTLTVETLKHLLEN